VRVLRSLLLLVALVSPARSQDGPHDADTARNAAQALEVYLAEISKLGQRPDYTKPPAAELFQHVFDTTALMALPPAQSTDIGWELEWGAAVNRIYKRIMLFGLEPDQDLAQRTLQRNLSEYQDQHAAALDFMIRFQARQAATVTLLLKELPPEERTSPRAAGLQQSRLGAAQTIIGAIMAIAQGMEPTNARTLTIALRDTQDVWATYLTPADRSRISAVLAEIPATVTDPDVRNNLAAFADALAAAN
jgi:hypothetical protein